MVLRSTKISAKMRPGKTRNEKNDVARKRGPKVPEMIRRTSCQTDRHSQKIIDLPYHKGVAKVRVCKVYYSPTLEKYSFLLRI